MKSSIKRIVQRNLPLNTKYTLLNMEYLPMIETGEFCFCANCNLNISHIATVQNEEGQKFKIGFDCLETFLINNELLDGNDINRYKFHVGNFQQGKRFATKFKELVPADFKIDLILFHTEKDSHWYIYLFDTVNNRYKTESFQRKIKNDKLQNAIPFIEHFLQCKIDFFDDGWHSKGIYNYFKRTHPPKIRNYRIETKFGNFDFGIDSNVPYCNGALLENNGRDVHLMDRYYTDRAKELLQKAKEIV